LTGHNGKVNSIKWSKDDTKMVSCGKDGAVYLWSILEYATKRREGEHVLKNCDYTCAVLAHNNTSIYVVGSDRTLKEIEDSQVTREMGTKEVYTQVRFISLSLSLYIYILKLKKYILIYFIILFFYKKIILSNSGKMLSAGKCFIDNAIYFLIIYSLLNIIFFTKIK